MMGLFSSPLVVLLKRDRLTVFASKKKELELIFTSTVVSNLEVTDEEKFNSEVTAFWKSNKLVGHEVVV